MLNISKFSGHFKYARAYMRIGRYAPEREIAAAKNILYFRLAKRIRLRVIVIVSLEPFVRCPFNVVIQVIH